MQCARIVAEKIYFGIEIVFNVWYGSSMRHGDPTIG